MIQSIFSKYYDAETGLHYNWHRYYWPESGRYISPEPALQILLYEKIQFNIPNIPKSFIPIFAEQQNTTGTSRFIEYISGTFPHIIWAPPHMVDEPWSYHTYLYSLNNPVSYYDPFAMLWLCKLDHSETNCWKECAATKCERVCVYLCRRGVTSGPIESYYLKWTRFLPCPRYWAH